MTSAPVPSDHLSRSAKLAGLRAQLRRLDRTSVAAPGRSARGVFPDPTEGAVGEALPETYMDTPAAFAFLIALMARAAAARSGPVLLSLCEQKFDFGLPNPAALAAAGIPASRILLIRAPDARGVLWTLEEGARTRGVAVSAAACLPDHAYGLTASRRLALAAERTGVPVLLLRAAGSRAPSAGRSRWRIQGLAGAPAPWSGATGLPGLGPRRWRVTQDRAAGALSSFEVEWNETALRFDPPAALVHGPAGPRIEPSIVRAA